jgi:hypothetical protein
VKTRNPCPYEISPPERWRRGESETDPIRINLRTARASKKRRRNRKEIPQIPLLHKLSVSLSWWDIMEGRILCPSSLSGSAL